MRGITSFYFLRAAKPSRTLSRHVTPLSSSSASRSLTTSTTNPFDPETYLSNARAKFAAQKPTIIPDVLSPTPSRLLALSLADYVRPTLYPPGLDGTLMHDYHYHLISTTPTYPPEGDEEPQVLPQGHHLVYFPLQLPPSALMPDGTDPAHWPGGPFVRRMWAGGEVVFHDRWDSMLQVDGRAAVCVESVVGSPVLRTGRREGEEKVFVDVRREYGLKERFKVVDEVRRLVFLREREGESGAARSGEEGAERVVKASAVPEFTFSLTPDAKLLFHFSALTYNAHAIHIDPEYARHQEGYRGLLVHGPLTLVLMLSALRACLARLQQGGKEPTAELPFVRSLNYRNLAPLYVKEEMKVCLRRTRAERDQVNWDVWIEGPKRGLAVKAHAITTGGSSAA